MRTLLRTLMLLALIVWVGGIIFFAFVMAPAAFRVLPSIHLAASIVAPTLTALHWMGIVSGLVFLVCSVALNLLRGYRLRLLSLPQVLVAAMLILTAVSQFGVTPAMDRNRIDMAAQPSPRLESQFDRLHHWSERLEGGVLLLGLGTVVLTARRFS